jgi:hypothetical protein
MMRGKLENRVSKLEWRLGANHEELGKDIQDLLGAYEKLSTEEKEQSNEDALVWYSNFLNDKNENAQS